MSIASEITRISNAKTAIASAITDKGVTVPSGTKIDGMATLIGQISGTEPTYTETPNSGGGLTATITW